MPLVASHAATQTADGFLRQPGAKFFGWLFSKFKGSPAIAELSSGAPGTDTQEHLNALRLEIEKLAGSDLEFRQQLAEHSKELTGATAVDANHISAQTGDNNKSAQVVGTRIKIQIG